MTAPVPPGSDPLGVVKDTRMGNYAAVVAASAAVADALTKCVLLAEERCANHSLRAFGARQIA